MAQSPDPFEFFSGGGAAPSTAAEICIADDVFHNGRLLPFNSKTHAFDYRRCESDGSGNGGKLTAEYRNLRRAASEPNGPQRAPPPPSKAKVRPRWYWLVFWSVRAPAEMGIDDIKSRQKRWRSTADVTEVNGGWRAWRVIRSLNCKGEETAVDVNVTAPSTRRLAASARCDEVCRGILKT